MNSNFKVNIKQNFFLNLLKESWKLVSIVSALFLITFFTSKGNDFNNTILLLSFFYGFIFLFVTLDYEGIRLYRIIPKVLLYILRRKNVRY